MNIPPKASSQVLAQFSAASRDWKIGPRVPLYSIHAANCDTLTAEQLWLRAADSLRVGFDNLKHGRHTDALWCFSDAFLDRISIVDTYVGKARALDALNKRPEALAKLDRGQSLWPGQRKLVELRRRLG